MIVVDALDEGGADFYPAHGFPRLAESLRLALPMRVGDRRGGVSMKSVEDDATLSWRASARHANPARLS